MKKLKKRKLRILHLITSLDKGGAQKNLLNICSSCEIKSFVICLSKKSYFSKKLDEIGVDNLSLEINLKNLFSIFKLFKIIKILNSFKPDIIQTWLYHADFIGSIIKLIYKKYKLIWTIRHSDVSLAENKLTTFLLIRLLITISYKLPDKIVYCAKASIFAHERIKYCRGKRILIHNGLDINNKDYINYQFSKDNEEFKLSNDTFIFISVARFHPIKNHFLLLNAFKDAKNVSSRKIHLLMLGENIVLGNKEINDFIKINNLYKNITLLGPKDNVYHYLKKAHFFILSSNSEAFPNVLLESSLCCTPCISTNVGDAKYIIGKYGYITTKNNRSEMKKAILKASELSQLDYENLAIKTRERSIELFSYERMISKYNSLYLNLF
tara:strand:- start:4434 stop:5579 length:1146 start_codon:yes stop_codon:yes gene_type:complete